MDDLLKITVNDEDEINKLLFILYCDELTKNKEFNNVDGIIDEIKKLMKELKSKIRNDKLLFSIVKLATKFYLEDNSVGKSNNKNLDNGLSKNIEEINFEKECLKKLSVYFKNCKKSKNYETLSLAFQTLVLICSLDYNRQKKSEIEINNWKCGVKRIDYIPSLDVIKDTSMMKEDINQNLQKLKVKR